MKLALGPGHSDSDSGLARLLTPSGPLCGLECYAFNQACLEYLVSAEWAPVGQVIVIRNLAKPDSSPLRGRFAVLKGVGGIYF